MFLHIIPIFVYRRRYERVAIVAILSTIFSTFSRWLGRGVKPSPPSCPPALFHGTLTGAILPESIDFC